MQTDINAPLHAYLELDVIACEEVRKNKVSLFSELPLATQKRLLEIQEEVFAKHGVTREDFNLPENEPAGSFIVPVGQTPDIS